MAEHVRVAQEERWPPLEREYPLTDEQMADFERQGHVLLRGVVSPEDMRAYRPALLEAIQRHEKISQEQAVGDGANQGWKLVSNLWQLDAAARRFVTSPRLGRLAASLLGVEAVRLFRDHSYFKEPGGAGTPWHQDCYFLPLDTSKVVSTWIALDDVSPEMSPLTFATGSHQHGYVGTSAPSDDAIDAFGRSLAERGFDVTNYGRLKAGDATFHAGWTLHSAQRNTSDRVREALVIIYYADGARVALPALPPNAPPIEQHAAQIRRQSSSTFLPGLKDGELAATALNPIVYQRR